MNWNDAEDIGIALFEAYPNLDPLTVRFTDLHKMVLDIDHFDGNPQDSSEARLEAIQMAWLEEFQDNK
jgi:FeS assembly protein IscX